MNITDLDTSKIYTYADYLTWDFLERVELIKGKVWKMSPAPSRKHQQISREISRFLSMYFHGKKCEFYVAPFDVRLPKKGENEVYTVVQPDICIICDSSKLDEQGCIGAPDLIMEILSPGNSKKEMRDKFEVYEDAGVKEYWIINPLDKNILVYLLNEKGKFIGLKPFTEDMKVSPFLFPDLEIDLKEVFI
ncbi:MAG: Uma2 family endonuclease [Flammeovirgaceae bacterium]